MNKNWDNFWKMLSARKPPTPSPVLVPITMVPVPPPPPGADDARYEACYSFTAREEGGLADRPFSEDPGGVTNRGVTLNFARSLGTMFDINKDGLVDRDDILLIQPYHAKMAFRATFWRDIRGETLWAGMDLSMFDMAIHSGASRSIKTFQKVCGLEADGVIGPKTLYAMAAAAGRDILLNEFNDERKRFLRSLKNFNANPGWLPRVDRVLTTAKRMKAAANT